MKKTIFSILLVTCTVIQSCDKNKQDVAQPQSPDPKEEQQEALPSFDESNSEKISWDQLPDDLKFAKEEAVSSDTILSSSGTSTMRAAPPVYVNSIGSWGGNGGTNFLISPNGRKRIYALAISTGVYLASYRVSGITIWYQDLVTGFVTYKSVGTKGPISYKFKFERDEFIYRISGYADWYVDKLKIYTNKRTITIGGTSGRYFNVQAPSGHQILGLYGRAASVIDRIGVRIYTR